VPSNVALRLVEHRKSPHCWMRISENRDKAKFTAP
jgi:hypothetical protein